MRGRGRAELVETEVRIRVADESDIVSARQQGRRLAAASGFTQTEQTLIATAISEVARNILTYAGVGELIIEMLAERGRRGIQVIARDEGPGIADCQLAMRDGYSTRNSLGLGLPGAKRLMDEFKLESVLGKGTTVTMRKWAA